MQYQKPEIARLGKATELILGCKGINIEILFQTAKKTCDCELDD